MIQIGVGVIVLGALLSLVAAIGVLRLPSTLSRLHAATKSASLGLALIMIGAATAAQSWPLAAAATLVSAFQFLTAPIAGHLLGRAAVLASGGTRQPAPRAISAHPRESSTSDVSIGSWLALTVGWALLWQDLSIGTVVAGAVVAYVVLRLLPSRRESIRVRPLAALSLVIRYLGLVLTANARVAWEVVTPDDSDIREAIVDVPLRTPSPAVATFVAHAVSFTPGTLTVELDADESDGHAVLGVHTMHFTSREAIERDVGNLETWASRAIDGDPTPDIGELPGS